MDALRALMNSTAELGKLNLSLTPAQQSQLEAALRLVQERAMQDAAQKIMRAICPLCDMADHNPKDVEPASQNGDGIHFWHKSQFCGTHFRRCLADPIRQLSWVKL